MKEVKMLNAKLKHHLARSHTLPREISAYIYIYIYREREREREREMIIPL